jgi:ribosomal protein L34
MWPWLPKRASERFQRQSEGWLWHPHWKPWRLLEQLMMLAVLWMHGGMNEQTVARTGKGGWGRQVPSSQIILSKAQSVAYSDGAKGSMECTRTLKSQWGTSKGQQMGWATEGEAITVSRKWHQPSQMKRAYKSTRQARMSTHSGICILVRQLVALFGEIWGVWLWYRKYTPGDGL